MAARLTRNIAHSLKGRLYCTQVASKSETSVRGGELKNSAVNDIKVASLESKAPISRVVFGVKAGSKYEHVQSLGMSHVIRHVSQLTGDQMSFEELVEDLQGLGCSLSFSTTRDNAYITVTGVREHIFDALSLVYPALTRKAFLISQFNEHKGLSPKIELDIANLHERPDLRCIETLHEAAFRGGLGNSLYMKRENVGNIGGSQVLSWIKAYYQPERMAVAATGVYHEELEGAIQLIDFPEANIDKPKEPAVSYKPGDVRVPITSCPWTVYGLAFEGPSLTSPDMLAAAVLQQVLGTNSQLKYKKSASGRLNKALANISPVSCYNANYADSGLFGFLTVSRASKAGEAVKKAREELMKVASGGVTDEEVARAKNIVAANIGYDMESGNARATKLAEQLLGGSDLTSLREVLKLVDGIQTKDVNATAKKIMGRVPCSAAVGGLGTAPYLH